MSDMMTFPATGKNVGATDTISRQQAIDALNEVVKDHSITDFDAIASILDLPPAQPEQTGCEYCNEDVEGYVKPIEKNGHVFVRFGMNGWELSMKLNGWHRVVKIRYCPMCGRDLLVK